MYVYMYMNFSLEGFRNLYICMDQDHYELIYRLNKPVMSCSSTGHNIDPINNLISANTSATTSMFRTGPVVLIDQNHIHNHDHDHICDDHDDDENNSKMIKALGHSDDDHLMKTQIAHHPSYPDLLAAYIRCQKVGAPPETASLLEEIGRENRMTTMNSYSEIGADPELDCFMNSYCEVLQRFNEELSKPLNEAATFLSNIESQLKKLCEGTLTKTLDQYDYISNDRGENIRVTSDGDQVIMIDDHDHHGVADAQIQTSGGVRGGAAVGPTAEHDELKEKLLRKYNGYVTMLKSEFLKKRKKVELPKQARSTLLLWWNAHSRWPYPTEEEKVKLSEETGLDQKQINNWFVNQRKRHWKPSADIKSAFVDDSSNK